MYHGYQQMSYHYHRRCGRGGRGRGAQGRRRRSLSRAAQAAASWSCSALPLPESRSPGARPALARSSTTAGSEEARAALNGYRAEGSFARRGAADVPNARAARSARVRSPSANTRLPQSKRRSCLRHLRSQVQTIRPRIGGSTRRPRRRQGRMGTAGRRLPRGGTPINTSGSRALLADKLRGRVTWGSGPVPPSLRPGRMRENDLRKAPRARRRRPYTVTSSMCLSSRVACQ